MQIFVRNLEGRTIALDMGASASVEDVKQLIEAQEGISVDAQTLICSGKQLANEEQLFDEACLQLVASLDGGAKKRKKKVYKTPKKARHTKKKVKVAVLRFYKVAGGKVSRTRRTCVECGPSVFMAAHADRLYCGRCHVTLALNQ